MSKPYSTIVAGKELQVWRWEDREMCPVGQYIAIASYEDEVDTDSFLTIYLHRGEAYVAQRIQRPALREIMVQNDKGERQTRWYNTAFCHAEQGELVWPSDETRQGSWGFGAVSVTVVIAGQPHAVTMWRRQY